jgi:hypothetical protein
MNNIFITAGLISILFLIIKFIEMKYLDKENQKPFKLLVRDALLVYFSVVCGYLIIDQIEPITQIGGNNNTVTPVFTNNPEF